MKSTRRPFRKHTGEIFLLKRGLLGILNRNIIILVTESFKIILVKKSKTLNFIYTKGDIIDSELLSDWIVKNNYDFYFITESSKLKKDFYFYFYDVILYKKREKKSLMKKLFCLLKNGIFIKK
jgi:hypothetical protein